MSSRVDDWLAERKRGMIERAEKVKTEGKCISCNCDISKLARLCAKCSMTYRAERA
jgi:hypothetical protein